VLIGGSAWAAVAVLSDWLLPAPKHLLEELRRSVFSLASGRGLLLTLLLMALSPAICEEALFRGPILRGLRSRLSPAAAAVMTGVLFGLFHLDLYRLIPTTILGILLGFLALASGSILPAMLAHFCNNAILLVLATSRLDQRMEDFGPRTLALVVCASVTLTATGFALLRGKGQKVEM
jgi:sodium transport system permease protein